METAVATFERNIETATGRPITEWITTLQATNLAKHGQLVAWLKTEHGLSHSHANHLAKLTLQAAAPRSEEDPVEHLFVGNKQALRPLYDKLVTFVLSLGPDVEIAPKKANVSVRRAKQFALIQPSTATRLDLGLILKNQPPVGRLEASGSFNAMFSHRIKLTSLEEVDQEIESWLTNAYGAAI